MNIQLNLTFSISTASSAKTYFLIKNANNDAIRIKKKTFCWLLNGEHDKLSNDRIVRFQGSKDCRTQPLSIVQSDEDQVRIGECQFRHGKGRWKTVIIDQIINFLYLNKKTKKEARYSFRSALIKELGF